MPHPSESRIRVISIAGILFFVAGAIAVGAIIVLLFQAVQKAREAEALEKRKQAESETRMILRRATEEWKAQLPETMRGE